MKNFTKLLFICVVFLSSQISKAQSIVLTYNCTGAGNALLSVSPTTNITSYTWRSSVTGTTVLASTSTYIPTQSATYTVNIVRTGQPATLTYAFTLPSNIVPNPPTVTPATTTTLICGTATQTLNSSAAANYAWTRDGTDISGASASTLSVAGTSATPGTYSYRVRVINSVTNCPALSNPVQLTLSPKPATPTITPANFNPNVICGSDVKTLNATSGETSYSWRRSDGILTGTSTNSLDIRGTDVTVAGTYSYTVSSINQYGCSSDYSSPAVTLQLFPAASLPSQPTIAQIGGVFLTGSSIGACEGTTVGLTSSYVSSSNVWSLASGNDITTTGTNGIVINTVGSYIYSVRARDNNGCLSPASNPVQVLIYAKPVTPTITTSATPTQICGSEVKTLTASLGGGSYTWIRSNNNTNTTLNSPITNIYDVTGSSITTGGTYNFTVASSQTYFATRNGSSVTCTSGISQPVSIILFPTSPAKPTIDNNGRSLTFCEGGTVNLKSSYISSTNIWNRTAGGDTTTTATDEIIVRTSNIITVRAKDANGCTSVSSDPVTVKVNPRPIRPNLNRAGNIEICELDSTEVNATNGYTGGTYSWYKDNTPISSKSNIFLKADGNYTLEYTEGVNQCKSLVSLPTVLKVNPLPVKPTLSTFQSRPLEYCYKNENSGFNFATLLATSSTPNAKFLWDNGRIANTIDTTILLRSNKTETIKVTAISISDKGCKSKDRSDGITITVNPLPITPNISAGGPLTFCPDSTITLTSTDSPTGVYKWINAKDNSEFNTSKTVLIDTTSKFFYTKFPEKVGRFYVRTISDKSCVSDTSRNIIITVRNAPEVASIKADPSSATVCLGGKVTLQALVANGNIAKYSWRDESSQQEVSTQQEVSVITSGTFSVKVRDVFGCFAAYSKPLKVSINSLPNKPTLTLIKPKVFCDEDSVVVQASEASTTPKGKKTSYRWIVDGLTVTESFESVFSWKRVGVISVALTDSNGCKAAAVSDTIRTTVNPLPNSPTISVRGANPFCADKNVALNAVGANGVTYKWSTGAITQTIITNTAGNITVQAINGFGCLSKPSQPVLIRVNPLPSAPKLTANGDVTFCEGSRVRIVSSSAFKAYWFRSTTDSIGLGEDNTSIFASKTGSYFAKVQDDNGCISSASAPIAVDSRPNPTPTIINQIGSFTLDAQGLGDENGYLWRYNGDLQRDLTTKLIKAKKDGDYQVQASITYTGVNIAGGKLVCYSKVSDAIKYIQDISFEGVSIFPNPSADGVIYIEAIEDLPDTKITIYDLYGRIMADYTIDKLNTIKRIELPNLQGTTYIVKIISGGLEKTRKVLIF